MKVYQKWVFATLKKGWGVEMGREKEGTEKNISSER